jgi:hypothetical protein
MNTCKANRCVRNQLLIYPKNIVGKQWNDFKRCNKQVYMDEFCKLCYEHDKRNKHPCWIDDQRWKRDGIYGESYDFPFHTSPSDKEWVEMMYTLHPYLKPKGKFWKDLVSIEDRKQMLDVLKENLTDEEILYLCENV